MSILDLWLNNRANIENKNIEQIVQFCGDGRLNDNSKTSLELREFLKEIPTELLNKYINECTEESFRDNGLVLQDIINEIGLRLGYNVIHVFIEESKI